MLREKKGDRNSPSEEPETRLAREKEEARRQIWRNAMRSPTGFRRRDEQHTKRLAARTDAEANTDALKESSLPDLRKVSREEYLRKREAQKLEELKESLEDEKTLFQGVELSEKEKRDIAYRRRVYELATAQIRDIDSIMEDRYRLPSSYDESGQTGQDERFKAALRRYKDPDGEDANPNAEQERWEKHQIAKVTTSYGAKDGAAVRQGRSSTSTCSRTRSRSWRTRCWEAPWAATPTGRVRRPEGSDGRDGENSASARNDAARCLPSTVATPSAPWRCRRSRN